LGRSTAGQSFPPTPSSLQPNPMKVRVGPVVQDGQAGAEAREDYGATLERNEYILLEVGRGRVNREQAITWIGERVQRAVVQIKEYRQPRPGFRQSLAPGNGSG
jgi:hypothetical protein